MTFDISGLRVSLILIYMYLKLYRYKWLSYWYGHFSQVKGTSVHVYCTVACLVLYGKIVQICPTKCGMSCQSNARKYKPFLWSLYCRQDSDRRLSHNPYIQLGGNMAETQHWPPSPHTLYNWEIAQVFDFPRAVAPLRYLQ